MVDLIKINDLEIASSVEGTDYVLIVQDGITRVARSQDLPFVVGPKGDKGDTGAALSVKGTLNDPSELPANGNPGDAYFIAGNIWVWIEEANEFQNLGQVKGEKGDKGDTGETGEPVRILGTLNNTSELPATGDLGNAYIIGTDLYFWNDIAEQWQNVGRIKGETGEKGDKGDIGQPLIISGVLESEVDLPIDAVEGEAWMVGDFLYQFSNGAWHNLGTMRGPAGAGMPTGGKTNQIAIKTSDDDYVFGWTYLHDLPAVNTIAAAQSATFDDAITTIILDGRLVPGDTFERMYFAVTPTLPSHTFRFSSADGKIWELKNKAVTLEMAGGAGDGTTLNNQALLNCISLTPNINLVPTKTYKFNQEVSLTNPLNLNGNGAVLDFSTATGTQGIVLGKITPEDALTVSTDIAAGASSTTFASIPASWVSGAVVKFYSNTVVGGTVTTITELNVIDFVSGTTVSFKRKFKYSHTVSASAKAQLLPLFDNCSIKDVTFKGRLSTFAALDTQYLRNFILDNVIFDECNIAGNFYDCINTRINNVVLDQCGAGLRGYAVEEFYADNIKSINTGNALTFPTSNFGLSNGIVINNISGVDMFNPIVVATETVEDILIDGVDIKRSGTGHRDIQITNPNVVNIRNVISRGSGSVPCIEFLLTNNSKPYISVTDVRTETTTGISIPGGPSVSVEGIKKLSIKGINAPVFVSRSSGNTLKHANIEIEDVILANNTSSYAVNVVKADNIIVRNVIGKTTGSTIQLDTCNSLIVTNNITDSDNANSYGASIVNSNTGIVTGNIFKQNRDYKAYYANTSSNNTNILLSYDNYLGANTKTPDQVFVAKANTGNVITRNVTVSTSDPTGGVDGDIWFKVT